MLLIPNPFLHEREGYYGAKQESLIEFVGAVAGVITKTPLARYPLVGIIAGGISISCDVALYLDERAEDKYHYGTSMMGEHNGTAPTFNSVSLLEAYEETLTQPLQI